ncbi:MAG TPA: YihY/virulence factor BrkB family protein [Vicinamibacterales bacterium]|nr:YihY/virulence factor BrkB family protein [Vicinamibacterales bacterium]
MTPGEWGEILTRAARAIFEDNCLGWAAELAYFWFLAPFPALLFAVALAAYLPVQSLIDTAVRTLALIAPGDVLVIVRDQLVQITHVRHAGLLTFSLFAAVWSGSSGMMAIIDTLNQAYHVKDTRPWWRVRALAIALTLALATLALVSLALALAGPYLAQWMATSLHLGSTFAWTWRIAQWVLIVGLLVTALEWIYYFAPDVRHQWVWITPGSLTAATLGLVLSLGFQWYASHFGDYQKTYGAIGGVIVALLWLYGSGLAILIGAELNAAIEHVRTRGRGAALPTPFPSSRSPDPGPSGSIR